MQSITRIRAALLVLALLVLTPCAASAEGRIYRWLDANGAEHFGDTPPANARSIKVKQTSSGINAGAELPVVDEAACTRKRDQLKSYQLASKLTETNALGETREYSDAERQQLIAVSETQARAACGEG
ncbi:DUF4124 domain-containing protein [Nevskia sp.]|uniref:DUF4124 domain-containing protein n=1 Tax=Nevskia sp. TaxID=1929292 RepID=UPI0025D3A7E3|nr:DUF4124 domain-containing protein [Nevskia sp.]